jgi:2,3-bisphosphoglycerate-independent phosphoglycerate mutase
VLGNGTYMEFGLLKKLSFSSKSKIILVVIDGLGGLPYPQNGKTELERAATPNLDDLALKGACGLIDPVAPGITPGSGPGHLGIFGYDPIRFNPGRGVLAAAGIEFDLGDQDLAARGNFATIDEAGNIKDRRAGRISTDKNKELCGLLENIKLDKTTVLVRPVREHRFLAVFRGKGLSDKISDTDPQQTGEPAKKAAPMDQDADKTAELVNEFISQAKDILSDKFPANMILLRGFSKSPQLPGMKEIYSLKAAAIAMYPMYRGLTRLLGMEVLDAGSSIEDEFDILKKEYRNYDFLFLHIKQSDSAGEDGDFDRKVRVIEEVDSLIPIINGLGPDVLVITGDHSTPAILKNHSWHPVPIILSSKWCRPDKVVGFSESECIQGGLGRFSALEIMPLAMANALKLKKFGA